MMPTQSSRMVWPLAAFLVLAPTWAFPSPTSDRNGSLSSAERVDINKTVLEVEKILDKYPELPRIERGEILTILQNITEEDSARLKDELTGVLEEETQKMKNSMEQKDKPKNKTRSGGSRSESVMVVLPFNADEQQDSLEELFTRSPIVRMEKQPSTTEGKASPATHPPFSVVEKEDAKFNPPLRVIGFRYHTTAAPESNESQRTYTNFQSPEQVTMTFTTQEFKPSLWNHKIFEPTTEVSKVSSSTTESDLKFHIPDAMDNFGLDDVMIQDGSTEKAPFIVSAEKMKPETTQKIYITSEKSEEVPTTTEEVFWQTTKKSKKEKSKVKLTSTTSAPKVKDDLSNVIETLPPNLRDMLSNLGVENGVSFDTGSQSNPLPIRSATADIDPTSYMAFKPIPVKRQKTISDDMQTFLASFGLLDGNRQQKAVPETTTEKVDDRYLKSAPEINTDFLTDSMKETLENLGLFGGDQNANKAKTPRRNHIFNPKHHTGAQTDDEVRKLNSLLATIRKLASLNDSEPVTPEFQREILEQVKELDNITISYKTSEAINEEIHKIMERNKGKFKIPIIMKESSAFNTLENGLNPEFYEEIQLKNEVKRQENQTSSTEGSSTTTTEEPSNAPELEDSFGGGDVAPSDSDPGESLPPKRPNGLYLLLDWNTFFEVGTEDDARRVNIRFQPKIGDGRNFLPVTIP